MLTPIGQIPHWAAAQYSGATALAIGGQEFSFADLTSGTTGHPCFAA